MRKVIEISKVAGVQIAKITNMKGELVRYQVEDPKLGRPNIGEYFTLRDARVAAAVPYNPPVKETLPKTAYPEQRDNYDHASANR